MVEDYQWLVEKYSSKFAAVSNLSQTELKQQGFLILLEAAASWDPAKGSLPSRLKYRLATGLHNYTKKYYTQQTNQISYEDISPTDEYNPERLCIFKEAYSALSQNAKLAMLLLMEEVDTSVPPLQVRGLLVEALHNYMGKGKAWHTLKELKALAQ